MVEGFKVASRILKIMSWPVEFLKRCNVELVGALEMTGAATFWTGWSFHDKHEITTGSNFYQSPLTWFSVCGHPRMNSVCLDMLTGVLDPGALDGI